MCGFAVVVFAIGIPLALMTSGTPAGWLTDALILLLVGRFLTLDFFDRLNGRAYTILGAVWLIAVVAVVIPLLYLAWIWLQPMITCHYAYC
jgi:hypothetical protein